MSSCFHLHNQRSVLHRCMENVAATSRWIATHIHSHSLVVYSATQWLMLFSFSNTILFPLSFNIESNSFIHNEFSIQKFWSMNYRLANKLSVAYETVLTISTIFYAYNYLRCRYLNSHRYRTYKCVGAVFFC